MLYLLPAGGCMFPVQHFHGYGILPTPEEGETVKTLELIRKEKNVFGDTIYYIRDERCAICVICESDVETYLRQKGVSSLVQGSSYIYPNKR